MADLAIISAIYGDYDIMKKTCPQQGIDVEWVMVTDDPEMSSEMWRVVYDPRSDRSVSLASKHPKFCPWEYTSAPASIWVDGSMQVKSPFFAVQAVALASPIAEFDHHRNCIYDEARASAGYVKYAGSPIHDQVEHYRTQGHPADWGLWTTSVIARKHTEQVKEFGVAWEAECLRWSSQCQISQSFVMRNMEIKPALFAGDPFFNDWVFFDPSVKHHSPSAPCVSLGRSDPIFEFWKDMGIFWKEMGVKL
jgi:hypothetical protein